ncbi:MAG: nucleoside-diphosphate sugar epimerase/dehydratase [Anaerolineaceae bacterium]|nr:polysaccharide biosynthesis protein [Betaproteobacteria bacterium]
MKFIKYDPRVLLAFGHDTVATVIAWYFAYLLRFNFEIPGDFSRGMIATLAWVVPLQAAVFWRFGLYRGIWRYASLPDLQRILVAVGVASLLIPLIILMLRIPVVVPRSVLVLDPILLILMMGGSRLLYRAWKEHRIYGLLNRQGDPVLVLGAGDAAVSLVKDLGRSQEWRVVGLLDDNSSKHDRMLHGIRVLGTLDELPAFANKLGVKHAIIALPSASHSVRRRAAQLCSEAGIKALTVPAFDDLMNGKVTVSQVRNVELDDLLGRDPVNLDADGLQGQLTGRVVMVTGAGGSIGSELCRQIARFRPELLLLFELNEFALYQMEQEFVSRFPDIRIACAIGDVKDGARLDQILGAYRPAVIFHAAAYKHVPLMERENTWQAIRNNVLGTYTIGLAAKKHGAEKFILISTDKAVNPTNVMGASKRLAEMVCQGLQSEDATRFAMVRFGNVLGSTGSVIPKFKEQIAQGGPVTVTHPDIIRYFMSIPEAAQLVLQAGLMSVGGEIFVMDMGEPIRIADLAKEMIRLSGFGEDEIKIAYSGLRPGEKLYEELLADDEHTMLTPHAKLRIAKARKVDKEWLGALIADIERQGPIGDEAARSFVSRWVPEYRPSPA